MFNVCYFRIKFINQNISFLYKVTPLPLSYVIIIIYILYIQYNRNIIKITFNVIDQRVHVP